MPTGLGVAVSPALGGGPVGPPTTLGSPSFAMIATLNENLTADGLWWSQAGDYDLIDVSNGSSPKKMVALVQLTGPSNEMLYSNDDGATWTSAGVNQTSITRGSMAYDAVNDVIHVCWITTPVNGGCFYRRYAITRATPGNKQTNIASIARDMNINLVLDSAAPDANSYEHPMIFWLNTGGNGKIVLVWGVGSSTAGAVKSEVRATMRALSNDVNDNTIGNWLPPLNEAAGAGATASINTSPTASLKWSKLAIGSGAVCYQSAAIIPSGDATYPGDMVLVYCTDGATWRVNRARWDAANKDWRTGMANATLDTGLGTLVAAIGLGSGYALKHQLGTRIAWDPASGKCAFGYPYWDAAGGDRVAFKWFTPAGVADAERILYSPGGAHSYAPTLDLLWDATASRLVATYIKTTTDAVYLQTWTPSGSAPSQAETLVYNTNPVDIPAMVGFRVANKLAFLVRDIVGTPVPPYSGFWGTMSWS